MRLTPVNKESEVLGAEFSYRGTMFMIARSSNNKYKEMFRKEIKPYQSDFDNGRMDNKTAEDIMVRCFASTILVGWNELVDIDTGEIFEYSVENAISLINDDKDFYEEAVRFSENIENYITESGEVLKEK